MSSISLVFMFSAVLFREDDQYVVVARESLAPILLGVVVFLGLAVVVWFLVGRWFRGGTEQRDEAAAYDCETEPCDIGEDLPPATIAASPSFLAVADSVPVNSEKDSTKL